MSTLLKVGSTIAFALSISLSTFACASEYGEFDDSFDDDQLRPEVPPCPMCKIKKPSTKPATLVLGLATAYSPSSVTNVSVLISNAAGSELRDYGSTVTVPNAPNTVEVEDNELCTVGSTGAPPTAAYVEFEFTTALGTETVGQSIPIESTCS